MNILELEITNIRGIPQLILKPEGKSIVVWGLNGSGKSAVVDSIDFLLTGRISRLEGEGTKGISLNKYGPHINHKPEDASVRATIKLQKINDTIEIKRCIANPNALEINCKKENKQYVEFIMRVAKNGQHVLTRREILKYIHSEPRNRAEKIQDLLNLSDVEEMRRTLKTVQNKAVEENRLSKRAVDNAKGAINATTSKKTYSENAVIEFININREVLGGKKIETISSETIQKDIRKPSDAPNQKGINLSLAEKDIENLQKLFAKENSNDLNDRDTKLREKIAELKADPRALAILSSLQLSEMGIKLIDESGSCPLCDIAWEPGKLKEHLEAKIEKGKEIAKSYDLISELSSELTNRINNAIGSLEKLIATTQKAGIIKGDENLKLWLVVLKRLIAILASPLEKYPGEELTTENVKRMCAPKAIEEDLKEISKLLKETIPAASPELNAWDSLTRLGENIKALEKSKLMLENSMMFVKRADCFYEKYLSARNSIIGGLYDSIRDRFVELYRQIHSVDEGTFKAILAPSGAGLDFEVDFYDKGSHPPHALHSEGHQDSMGICLYLALAEKLNSGLINIIILDDVVMSVDIEHRKQLCSLLSKSFPNKQFFITTHDRTWADQMKSEGIVDSSRLIEFNNWSLEAGPQVSSDVILWDQIAGYLERNDIPKASSLLRRGLESFFSEACDSLQALVKYNSNHRWELGDWYPAAMKRYRELIKNAKESALSRDKQDLVDLFVEKEKLSKKLFSNSQAEQWNINAAVHYNTWRNFVKEDFFPVVQAFKDVCSLFVCKHCGRTLRVSTVGYEQVNVCCNCGAEFWNMQKK